MTWANRRLGLCNSDSLGPGDAGVSPARRIDWLKGVLFGNVRRRDAGVPRVQRIDRAKTMGASHRMFNPARLACGWKGRGDDKKFIICYLSFAIFYSLDFGS
jgi:hypothetical protein